MQRSFELYLKSYLLQKNFVTVWSAPSDASVDGLIMCTIVSGHLEVLYGGEKGAEEVVLFG